MEKSLLKTAIEAAEIAGAILMEGFGTSFAISSKEGKNNLVTEYDHRSEEAIINYIKEIYPLHSFLAEESGSNKKEEKEITWVIDPLDGTVNFAHNLPIFSISIAAIQNDEILCGVVYHPILKEMFTSIKGEGAFLNGSRISVSDNDDISSAFLVTGFPYNVHRNPGHCVDHFIQMIRRGIPVRRLGSAALDLAYVACGRFDGFWEIELKAWDVAAGTLILREAGGLVTQYNGDRFLPGDDNMLATNGKIHDELSSTLQSCYLEFMGR
jgi:myo-inositol-1(or 4)-monophosphatase